MLNTDFTNDLLEHYKLHSSQRHAIIRESNDMLRSAKQAIFALHKKDIPAAEELLNNIREKIEKVRSFQKLEQKENSLCRPRQEGAFRAAMEEFFEASFYYNFLHDKEITFIEGDFGTEFYEEYLSALCDFSGELVRKAIHDVTEQNYEQILGMRDVTQSILGELIRFDMNGKLRSKHDDAWRNLKRLDEILYDVTVRGLKK